MNDAVVDRVSGGPLLRAARIAVAALALGCAGAVHAAASVMIWPIDPVIENGQRAAALWLENRDARPVTLQIRVLGWREESGEDLYIEDQDRVACSPPMTTVPPGKRQLIRLTRLVESAPGTEEAYRVLIDEIPQPDDESTQQGGQAQLGLKFQMHYSIPLFVYGQGLWTKEDPDRKRDPATAARPALSWHLAQEGSKRWLVMTNRGSVHARITQAAFDTKGEHAEIARGLLGYVLPGAQMRWEVPESVKLAPRPKLIATVNGAAGVAIESDADDAHR